jgi:hypothetical protein
VTATTEHASLTREIPGVGRLEFHETDKRREYRLLPEGKERRVKLPSVTTILGNVWSDQGLLQWVMREPNARQVRDAGVARGKDCHRFIETYLRDGVLLKFSDFDPEIKPYLQAAARFIFEREPEPVTDGVERLICHPELRYAGRLDLLATLNDSPALTLLDYKSNPQGRVYAKAHAQLMGYAVADRRCGGEPIERCAVVGLTGEGAYRLVETPMDEAAQVWLQAVDYDGTIKRLLKALGESS